MGIVPAYWHGNLVPICCFALNSSFAGQTVGEVQVGDVTPMALLWPRPWAILHQCLHHRQPRRHELQVEGLPLFHSVSVLDVPVATLEVGRIGGGRRPGDGFPPPSRKGLLLKPDWMMMGPYAIVMACERGGTEEDLSVLPGGSPCV